MKNLSKKIKIWRKNYKRPLVSKKHQNLQVVKATSLLTYLMLNNCRAELAGRPCVILECEGTLYSEVLQKDPMTASQNCRICTNRQTEIEEGAYQIQRMSWLKLKLRKRKQNRSSWLRNKKSTSYRSNSMNFSIRFSLKTRRINIYKRPSRSPRKLKTITDPRSRNFMRKIQISDKELLTSSVRSMRA